VVGGDGVDVDVGVGVGVVVEKNLFIGIRRIIIIIIIR
jgi:hypothetical protein